MEADALAYIERIDQLGGMVAAIERNYPQQEIADASFRFQQEVEARERIIVGVNDYLSDEPLAVPLLAMDPRGEKRHLARLAELRHTRDKAQAERCLRALGKAAGDGENVMPYLLDAVRAYCTLGEMTQALCEVYGAYMEVPVL
jgi:methylmalonyl-CoA mutase N-terminal domain/subunit